MKKLLFATVAASVLALGFSSPGFAQSLDLKSMQNACHGASTSTACRHLNKLAPKVKTPKIKATGKSGKKKKIKSAGKLKIKKLKPKVKKPKIKVLKPKVVKPKIKAPKIAAPKIKRPKIAKIPKVVIPKVKTPKVNKPKVIVTLPNGGKPKIKVGNVKKLPKIKVAKPLIKVAPKGGLVTAEDLRKKLAGAGTPAIKVAPKPGVVVQLPKGALDLAASQLQADSLARRDAGIKGVAALAAVGVTADVVQVFGKTLTADDIRRSSEDFSTGVLQKVPNTGKSPAVLDFSTVNLTKILTKGDKVISNSGDRMVIKNNGQFRVLRNDDVLLNRPGAEVQMLQYKDGSTRNLTSFEDGTKVETIRAPDGRVLRRASIMADGTEVVLFDDTVAVEQVVVNDLPANTGPTMVAYRNDGSDMTQALAEQTHTEAGRTFSLSQVRDVDAVRQLVPEISIDTIKFASNSAAIRPEEAEELAALGNAILSIIANDPAEVFLIEGHTDAAGGWGHNLALSDRRAESVALALIEYFGVPPENLVLQGYGEANLLIDTQAPDPDNRRAAVRRITPLLNGSI